MQSTFGTKAYSSPIEFSVSANMKEDDKAVYRTNANANSPYIRRERLHIWAELTSEIPVPKEQGSEE